MELVFNVIAIKGDIGYASDFERNGLFEVDMKTGKSRYIGLFPKEEIMISRLHSHCEWVDNKVYFIPSAGKNISIFDTASKEIETIEVPAVSTKQNWGYKPKLKFSKAIHYNDFLWLVPATYPGIIKLDLHTHKIVTISNWLPNDGYMFRRAVHIKENIIYAASGNNNNVLIFDLSSETGSIRKIGHMNNGIMDMCENGEYLIMAPRSEGAVVKWNIVTNEIKEYCDYPTEFNSGKIVFQCIYRCNRDFILVPAYASHGIRLSDEKLKIDEEIQWKMSPATKLELMFETVNEIYLREEQLNMSNRFYCVNKNDGTLLEFSFTITNSEERQKVIVQSAKENNEAIKETSSLGLQDWLKAMI